MAAPDNVIFLLDVDNTLLDNDRLRDDLMRRLVSHRNLEPRTEIASMLSSKSCAEVDYIDFLGAMQRYRLADMNDPSLLLMSMSLSTVPNRHCMHIQIQ